MIQQHYFDAIVRRIVHSRNPLEREHIFLGTHAEYGYPVLVHKHGIAVFSVSSEEDVFPLKRIPRVYNSANDCIEIVLLDHSNSSLSSVHSIAARCIQSGRAPVAIRALSRKNVGSSKCKKK